MHFHPCVPESKLLYSNYQILSWVKNEFNKQLPWTARRSSQSILKEINPEYSLEGLMLKLKLQYFGHVMQEPTHWKRPWCWEGLKARGKGDDRGWDGWMASLTQWTWGWASWCWTGKPGVLLSMVSQRVGHNLATKQRQSFYNTMLIFVETILNSLHELAHLFFPTAL